MIQITDAIAIEEREVEESFVRAAGPGGQNVNKVATAVQLRFDVRRSPSLPDDVRARLVKWSWRSFSSGSRPVPGTRRICNSVSLRATSKRCARVELLALRGDPGQWTSARLAAQLQLPRA